MVCEARQSGGRQTGDSLDLLAYDAIGVVVTVQVVVSGALNALGWAIVAVYLFFAVGSGYLLLGENRLTEGLAQGGA